MAHFPAALPAALAKALPALPALPALSSLSVEIGRDEARDAARRETSKAIYHRDDPSLASRILEAIWDWVTDLLGHASAVAPGGWAGLLAILVLAVLAVIAVRLRVGAIARNRGRDEPILADRTLRAEEHRAVAERYAAEARWAEAVRERLRGVARDLEERAILRPRAGRTARELAVETGDVLPEHAQRLRDAARLFDDVWYGGRVATAESYTTLRDLDERLRATRPALSGTST